MAPDTRDEFARVADTIPFRQLDSERARPIIAELFRQAQAAKSCATCQHSGVYIKWCDKDITIPQIALNQRDPTFSCSLHVSRAEAS